MTPPNGVSSLKKYGRSFYFASRFLGSQDTARAAGLYGICRWIDDLADETQDRAALTDLKDHLARRDASHPMVAEYFSLSPDMPSQPLIDLIDGALSDLDWVAFESQDQLEHYAYQVAGTVGLMMCGVFGVRDPNAVSHAVALGQAMQLTNIARDLVTDAKMGRRYMPSQWCGDLSPTEIVHPSAEQREAMQQGLVLMLNRADELYQHGFAGLQYLPPRVRLAIRIAAQVYREIGVRLQQQGLNPWAGRTVVPGVAKALLAIQSSFTWWRFDRNARP
jgi:phytoene synthase